jgi:hypothetical protein
MLILLEAELSLSCRKSGGISLSQVRQVKTRSRCLAGIGHIYLLKPAEPQAPSVGQGTLPTSWEGGHWPCASWDIRFHSGFLASELCKFHRMGS